MTKKNLKQPEYVKIEGEILSKEAFERYQVRYGVEKSEGFLDAVESFTSAIGIVLGPGYDGTDGVTPSSGTKVRKGLVKLYNHNIQFLISLGKVTPQFPEQDLAP